VRGSCQLSAVSYQREKKKLSVKKRPFSSSSR
jgi:hypothetical protein